MSFGGKKNGKARSPMPFSRLRSPHEISKYNYYPVSIMSSSSPSCTLSILPSSRSQTSPVGLHLSADSQDNLAYKMSLFF